VLGLKAVTSLPSGLATPAKWSRVIADDPGHPPPTHASAASLGAGHGPKLLVALRGFAAVERVQRACTRSLCAQRPGEVWHSSGGDGAVFVAKDLRTAAHLTTAIFGPRELADEAALVAGYEGCLDATLSPLEAMRAPALLQSAPLLVKPGVLSRGHAHKLWRAVLRAGFEVSAARLVAVDEEGVAGGLAHGTSLTAAFDDEAPSAEHRGIAGACMLLCLRRPAALRSLRTLAGPASPARAKRVAAFSLRAMFGADDMNNAVLVPRGPAEAQAALSLAFSPPPQPHAASGPGPPAAASPPDPLVPAGVQVAPARCLVRTKAASLSEVILVIVPPALLTADPEIVPATLLEHAVAERFEIVALRTTRLTEGQAGRMLSRARSPALTSRQLSAGPCVLLALQRDNAIARFGALLRAGLRRLAPPHAYASASAAAAAADLADAFDCLIGADNYAIQSVSATPPMMTPSHKA